jgi:hypothetical protein
MDNRMRGWNGQLRKDSKRDHILAWALAVTHGFAITVMVVIMDMK